MKRFVALLGDYFHDPEYSRAAIEAAFREQIAAGALTIVFADTNSLADELAADPELFILCKENRRNPRNLEEGYWLDDAKSSSIIRYVANGGRLLALHSGLCHYEHQREIRELLRGHFIRHPKQNKVAFKTSDTGETVLTIHDEHYFVDCDTERTHVFLTSHSEDGNSIAGWEHPYEQGRVCALTPAHNRSSLLDTAFFGLLHTAVDRLLAKEPAR